MVCSFLVSLGTGELVLRTWFPQRTLSQLKRQQLACYQPSQYLSYELRPFCQGEYLTGGIKSHARINSIGLRGAEVSEKGGRKILLIGDSFVFGYGVEEDENIVSRLEEELGVEVINGGVWGFGPDAEYLMAKKLVGKLKPDYLVVFLFPANDLRDLGETNWVTDKDSNLVGVENDKFVDKEGFLRRDAVSFRYYTPILNESHLAALIIDGAERGFIGLKDWLLLGLGGVLPSRREGPKIEGFENGGDIDCLYHDNCEGLWSNSRDKAKDILKRFYDLSQQNSLPIFVVIIPSENQLLGIYPERTIFHQLAERTGFPLLDLNDGLKVSGYSINELYLKDGHWSPTGNQVVAQLVLEYLKSKLVDMGPVAFQP